MLDSPTAAATQDAPPRTMPPPFVPILKLHEKVLLAMADLFDAEPRPTSVAKQAIAVAAFKQYPETFRLRGYPNLVDANKTFVQLASGKPLLTLGLIKSSGTSKFKLTLEGKLMAESLRERIATETREAALQHFGSLPTECLTDEELTELNTLFKNPTMLKRMCGAYIGPQDARIFWGIRPNQLAHWPFVHINDLFKKATNPRTVNRDVLSYVKLGLAFELHKYLIEQFPNIGV